MVGNSDRSGAGPSEHAHGHTGQSLTELAVALTVIMMLLAGVLDLGRAYYTFLALRDAAAEGAAYGAIYPTDTAGIQARVQGESPSGFVDWGGASVSTQVIGSACRGFYLDSSSAALKSNGVQVTVTTNYTLMTPFVGSVVGTQNLPLTATAVNTILSPKCP